MWISWRTKIRRRRFKERVKLIKMLHSGKDLLKTSEDIVPGSLEILHLDGRDGGGGGGGKLMGASLYINQYVFSERHLYASVESCI